MNCLESIFKAVIDSIRLNLFWTQKDLINWPQHLHVTHRDERYGGRNCSIVALQVYLDRHQNLTLKIGHRAVKSRLAAGIFLIRISTNLTSNIDIFPRIIDFLPNFDTKFTEHLKIQICVVLDLPFIWKSDKLLTRPVSRLL